ncbi:uncharacterized protein LOC126159842 [Schistocerca cancellata]|uniref:uncharacterized protein LOC126159842 n=1 Tax=Schistocerca cancellata TaxID=274614 RepID=UPI0021178426|nr:uncharacterized protein LOC126159842 [Schistocerca cancellata]
MPQQSDVHVDSFQDHLEDESAAMGNQQNQHNCSEVNISGVDVSKDTSNPVPPKTFWRFYSQDYLNKLNALFSKEKWTEMYAANDVNMKVNLFLDTMIHHFEEAFPLKPVRINNNKRNKTWITPAIKISYKHKRILHMLHKQSSDSCQLTEYYKNYTSILRRVIRHAKRMQTDKYIDKSSNKVKAMWNVIKRERVEIKVTQTKIEIKLYNESICNPEVVVDSFNKFFMSIAEKLVKNNPNTNYQPGNQIYHTCAESIFIIKVTENDVAKALRELKNSYSAGIDGISAAVIKNCVHTIAEPLTHLCDCSFQADTFAEALKLSKVIPGFKKGDNKEMNNYRPISISSCFSKVFEKIMYKKLKQQIY